MSKDLHRRAFDEGTKVKLSLYENYVKEWLPVFFAREPLLFNTINIFDFFSGPGKDVKGNKGSPLITLDLIYPHFFRIVEKKLTVNLFFNDYDSKKIEQLKKTIKDEKLNHKLLTIFYSSELFEKIFYKYLPLMQRKGAANFLFLDQNGIKHITEPVFRELINLPTTDFLFFISSSTLHRFKTLPQIEKYISMQGCSTKYCHIHRNLLEYYRTLIPHGKEYYLAPFSIKKGANIYGLIFGTSNILGIDKFLNQCWKIDPLTGDSNFDIDDDKIQKDQMLLPCFEVKPKKVEVFEEELKKAILEAELITNKDIYIFTINNGFIAKHARQIVSKMINKKKLPRQKLNISYDSCIKKKIVQTILRE